MRNLLLSLFWAAATVCLASSPAAASVGVTIAAPSNQATTGNPVHFVASAQGSTTIASMMIYVDLKPAYTVYAANVDTYLPIPAGAHQILIKAWDQWGGIYEQGEGIWVTNSSSSGGVTVSSPAANATVGPQVHFTASAAPAGTMPISSMIVYVDNQEQYLTYSNQLDTTVNVAPGSHTAIVKAWDGSGTIYQNTFSFTVSGTPVAASAPAGANTVYNIQTLPGWESCTVCAGEAGNGPAAGYSMEQTQASPSVSGNATKFSIWGSTPYSDVLWWKQILNGDANTAANSVPHHYIYDVDFYVTDPNAAQALEFDINHFVNGHSLIFGTQCNVKNGSVWDIWDNVRSAWVHTGKACAAPAPYTWHHVRLEMERAADGSDWLHYLTITLDGNTTYLGYWYPPATTSWNGITVNFQMDGDYAQHPYSVWLDNYTFSYY